MAKQPEKPEPPRVVSVAYQGIMAKFRLYETNDGKPYVRLPDGRRGFVESRRDGTYLLRKG